jgi:hypothetical protein
LRYPQRRREFSPHMPPALIRETETDLKRER